MTHRVDLGVRVSKVVIKVHEYRTHTCGELRSSDDGQTVRLSGWVSVKRDHGGLTFVDLRDHYGSTQLVFDDASDTAALMDSIPRESVIRVDGLVQRRPNDTSNEKLPTGEVEVRVTSLHVLGPSSPPPFPIVGDDPVGEDLRLRYRFLDLRRQRLQENILLRSKVIASLRRRMDALGFNEFQTPILTSSSPEGARDYLVPSRRYPGQFYALPQAPQQFKQLLMVSGFDRYYQIAPCFRDEDARADRSPGEFYQLDVEMSFATQEDVFSTIEEVLTGVFNEFGTLAPSTAPFVRIPYAESLDKYGSDKPDLRIPTEVVDITSSFQGSSFNAFADKTVKVLRLPGGAGKTRSWFDKLTEKAVGLGAGGLAWLTYEEDGSYKGPIAKFLDGEVTNRITNDLSMEKGSDAVIFVADDDVALPSRILGAMRTQTAEELDIIDDSFFAFCWITDFPMYEYDEERKAVDFSHNPFSMPKGGLDALNSQDPLTINAYQYDIVCNGYELSSGAVRNHDPETLYRSFEIAGYERHEVDEKFPALAHAFSFGAPPHAGLAPGIDRIVMLLTGESTIREVIAFPMNQQGQDLMMNAPGHVTEEQLQYVHIAKNLPEGYEE